MASMAGSTARSLARSRRGRGRENWALGRKICAAGGCSTGVSRSRFVLGRNTLLPGAWVPLGGGGGSSAPRVDVRAMGACAQGATAGLQRPLGWARQAALGRVRARWLGWGLARVLGSWAGSRALAGLLRAALGWGTSAGGLGAGPSAGWPTRRELARWAEGGEREGKRGARVGWPKWAREGGWATFPFLFSFSFLFISV
jgi:hypothetical protein